MTTVPLALRLTLTGKLKTLVPVVATIAVLLVQVMTLLVELQLQFAALVPPSVWPPSVTVRPVGRTSTMVSVPLVSAVPVLLTVKVYVVVVPTVTVVLPLLLVKPRLGRFVTVTESDAVLLPSLLSATLLFGSTTADELTRLPAAVGVTVIVTAKLPVVAPMVTLAPLAVQVNNLLPLIEQLMLAEFVIPVKDPTLGGP